MKEIHYIADDNNRRKAVVINIKTLERGGEDLQDLLIAQLRRDEPVVGWEKVKRKLRRQGKL